jgi:CheY-like chemotaxis protein
MSLVGSLEDLGLGDILQIVSLSRKSGVLNLNWGGVRGKIIFRDGQVVAALTNQEKPNLGQTLVERGLIPAPTVDSLQAKVGAGKTDLRQALIQQALLPHAILDQVIKEHIEEVVFGFFAWPEGNFNFELTEFEAELKNLSPKGRAFVLDQGLSPQYLAMEGTRLQDEYRRESAGAPVGPPRARPSEPPPAPAPSPPAAGASGEDDFSSVADSVAAVEARDNRPDPAPVPVRIPTKWKPLAPARPKQTPAPPPPQPLPAAQAAPAPVAAAAGPGRLLLVVDDDPLMMQSLAYHLGPKGFQVETFAAVSAVMARLAALPPNSEPPVIIADLLIPGWDEARYLGGLELLERARAERPQLPCILMTDYENPEAQQQAKQLGANFFFFKPKSSQLDEDFSSPELMNFVAVLQNALESLAAPAAPEGMVNLREELRREMGDEDFQPSTGAPAEFVPSRGLGMLKAMISELNDPSSSGQITLLILRFAAEMMNRAAIFLVARNQIAGLGQFGIELNGRDPERQVRRMRLPLSEPSIFQETVQKRMALKKKLRRNKWNDYLVEKLGGNEPSEVFVAPIIAGGRIAAILYGDNVPDPRPIGDTESLEIFLAQAGLAMEKALLERRLQELREPERS